MMNTVERETVRLPLEHSVVQLDGRSFMGVLIGNSGSWFSRDAGVCSNDEVSVEGHWLRKGAGMCESVLCCSVVCRYKTFHSCGQPVIYYMLNVITCNL